MLPRIRVMLLVVLSFCIFAGNATAGESSAGTPMSSEIVASIKEDGNVLLYSRHRIHNRLPISLETIRINATDKVEIIDVRDSEERLLRFSQKLENGRNEIIVQPREPVPVGGSMELFTVSLHKNLVQERADMLVFEYDYTPEFPGVIQYTAIVPAGAKTIIVEPEPKQHAGRRYSWEFRLGAGQPLACRIKYSQTAPFKLVPITSDEVIDKFAGSTVGYWRGNNLGAGWAWFYKGTGPHKNLAMPGDFRLVIKMKTLSAIDEKRRFGLMLDSTDVISFKRGDKITDPWGKVAYCIFWSNCDAKNGFAYGVLRNGELVASEKAPPIELKKEYEIALEREGSQLRLFVDGRKLLEYSDPSPLQSRHALRFGVHGPMSWEQIETLSEDRKYKDRLREVIHNLEWTFVHYSNPELTLIGADKEMLEYKGRVKPVDTINVWAPGHVFSGIEPIFMRINGFDEADFSPAESASVEEVSNIDLSRLGFKKVSSEPLKEVTIGAFHYEVPPEDQPATRLVSYSREGSAEPVLFIQMGQAPAELIAVGIFYNVRRQTNWGAYNGQDISQAFYPHLASMGVRKGRWLIHVSLPLEEGEASELEGKWETIQLFMRSIAGQILMHFYEMDMNAQ